MTLNLNSFFYYYKHFEIMLTSFLLKCTVFFINKICHGIFENNKNCQFIKKKSCEIPFEVAKHAMPCFTHIVTHKVEAVILILIFKHLLFL